MTPANRRSISVLIFVFFACLYVLSSRLLGRTETPPHAYFNWLADSFLHGRLDIVGQPSSLDLTFVDGRWYVPFPPLPAILMLPFVAASGPDGVNTVFFANLIGALNVTLVFLILEALEARKWIRLGSNQNLWLTALFGLGSVHWSVATIGSVWFVSQVCAVAFMALSVWIAVARGRLFWATVALALATLTRPHLAFGAPLLISIQLQIWRDGGMDRNRRRLVILAANVMVPLLLSALLLMAYNQIRFGNPLDAGYLEANCSPYLKADLKKYGQFHIHFVPRNLAVMLFGMPDWNFARGFPVPNPIGMSLLLTTPAFFLLGRAISRSTLSMGAWVTTGFILVPLLSYYNTGWAQFGYRFSLDFMVPLMILLGIAADDRIDRVFRVLLIIGVLVNLWGVAWFLNPAWPF